MHGANITNRQNAGVTRYRANITNRRTSAVQGAYTTKRTKILETIISVVTINLAYEIYSGVFRTA